MAGFRFEMPKKAKKDPILIFLAVGEVILLILLVLGYLGIIPVI